MLTKADFKKVKDYSVSSDVPPDEIGSMEGKPRRLDMDKEKEEKK